MLKTEQGLTYCRSEKKGIGKAIQTSAKYCKVCGFHNRGPNHIFGSHHQTACPKCEYVKDFVCNRQSCIKLEGKKHESQ